VREEKPEKNGTEKSGTETKRTETPAPISGSGVTAHDMNAIETYREIIQNNIAYPFLIGQHRTYKERIDELVDLMLETVCTSRKTIRIAGDEYPAELVKAKFLKLDSSHIEFVIDCMEKNTTEIRNIKKYLLAALFNAPSTIGSYYTSLVAHDMANGFNKSKRSGGGGV